jgi:hypothetical protein
MPIKREKDTMKPTTSTTAALLTILFAQALPAFAQFQRPSEQYARLAEDRLATDEIAWHCRELSAVELADLVRAQPPAAQLASGNLSVFCRPYSRRTGTDEGIREVESIVFVNRQGELLPIILKP